MPQFPVDVSVHHGVFGPIRSRAVGARRTGVPQVVFVPGLSVADYLMPSLGVIAGWTRAHLIELPGFRGRWGPAQAQALTVPEFGEAVADWLDAQAAGPVLLCGHSSGAQVVAEAAADRDDLLGVVLAGPIVDPAYRSLPALGVHWLLDGRSETPGLVACQWPEWWRAGPRRLAHLIRVHRRHGIEVPLRRVQVPLLVIHGSEDRLSRPSWARRLASLPAVGEYVEVPGSHSFFWDDPSALSAPIRRFATSISSGCRFAGSPTTSPSPTAWSSRRTTRR